MLLRSPTRTLHGAINRMFNPTLCESSQESSQGRLCDYALPKPRHGEDRVYAAPFLPTHLAWSDCRSNPTLCEFSQESLRCCKLWDCEFFVNVFSQRCLHFYFYAYAFSFS